MWLLLGVRVLCTCQKAGVQRTSRLSKNRRTGGPSQQLARTHAESKSHGGTRVDLAVRRQTSRPGHVPGPTDHALTNARARAAPQPPACDQPSGPRAPRPRNHIQSSSNPEISFKSIEQAMEQATQAACVHNSNRHPPLLTLQTRDPVTIVMHYVLTTGHQDATRGRGRDEDPASCPRRTSSSTTTHARP